MTPIAAKKIRSSTSTGFQVEPGALLRLRASHQAAMKPITYMSPYQWILTGPSCSATGSNSG